MIPNMYCCKSKLSHYSDTWVDVFKAGAGQWHYRCLWHWKVMFPICNFPAHTGVVVENLVRIHATVICGWENVPYKIRRNCPQFHSTAQSLLHSHQGCSIAQQYLKLSDMDFHWLSKKTSKLELIMSYCRKIWFRNLGPFQKQLGCEVALASWCAAPASSPTLWVPRSGVARGSILFQQGRDISFTLPQPEYISRLGNALWQMSTTH